MNYELIILLLWVTEKILKMKMQLSIKKTILMS